MDLFGRNRTRQLVLEASQLREQLAAEQTRPRQVVHRHVHRYDNSSIALPKQRFDMASGADNALTWSWTRSPMSADEVTLKNLQAVRARSRQQSRSNEYMTRFLGMVSGGVIGPAGITMQAKIYDSPGKLDTEACSAVEEAWARWGDEAANCDLEGRQAWVDHQTLFARTVAMDGEYLARLVVGRDAGPFGFCLQVLDPELLDVECNRDLVGGNKIRFGIEYNPSGRPVAYWLLEDSAYRSRKYTRVGAEQIIHAYVQQEVGQRRGWPWAYATLMSMNMLGGYEEAAVTAARIGASKSLVITSPDGEGEGIADDVETGDGEGDTEGVKYVDMGVPGSAWELKAGQDVKQFDPSYPTGEFGPFVNAVLRRICAGLNVSYAALSGDLSEASYSSARVGLNDERDAWTLMQGWAIRQFTRPIYRAWLPMALLSEQIRFGRAPATYTEEREEKYRNVGWQGRRWKWVDPESDVASNVTAIEQGLTTRSRCIRDMGEDPESVWAERAREDARLKELGISVPVVGQIPGSGKEGKNA